MPGACRGLRRLNGVFDRGEGGPFGLTPGFGDFGMRRILALLAIEMGGYFWRNRAGNAAHMAGDLADMAQDALGAARRFGFRRQANIHPVDRLEDGNVAVAALSIGYLEPGGLPWAEQQDWLIRALQINLAMSHGAAQEAVVSGRWLITE